MPNELPKKGATYVGLVSALVAPSFIDNDGIAYMVINLIDAVPPSPEVPYVLYIDSTTQHGSKNAGIAAQAWAGKKRVEVVLEPVKQSRIDTIKIK